MSNFFDKALHYLGQNSPSTFVMNLGAMDGEMFDEMIGYTRMYGFKGIYVEPIPYLFEKLKKNIGGDNLFENSAISDYDGEIEMMTIDQEVIDSGLVHSCFYGMSAVYPPKNGLGSEFDRPTVEKYGKIVKVPCITFDNLLQKHNIQKIDVVKIDAEGHDYKIFKQIDVKKFRPKIIRIEWINLSEEEQSAIEQTFIENNYQYEITGQDIVGIPEEFYNDVFSFQQESSNVTLVTGLWNINRDGLSEGWSRTFSHYLQKFEQLLQVKNNLIIFGDSELEKFVWERRSRLNTQFVLRDVEWFKKSVPFDRIQELRNNSDWYNQAGWLKDSTQARLEWYNPLVMSKVFLLNDARILDQFNSHHMYWIDAGLTNTVHPGYFTHDKIQDKLPKVFDKFGFVAFPYEANNEIHGFSYPKINTYAGNDVKLVCRGGLFGGPKHTISDINSIYYNLLHDTIREGLMGTEESIFSIILYRHSDLVDYVQIDGNGLISKFCEDVKNDTYEVKNVSNKKSINKDLNINNTALYVITFNSPKQFETLIESMIQYDSNFIDKPKKFLLDNSSDLSTTERYKELCEEFDFEHIKKDNLGICGGRQFVAEHADENGFDFYFFFEDDMFFFPKKGEVCRNGFNRYVDNLYNSSLEITKKEDLDFLKMNYSEFYGDNGTQWSWYNVPQAIREEFWPNKPILPKTGLDPNAPKTQFNSISTYKGIPFAKGEVYYCNWPQIVTKHGNKKMFLETKWNRPFEQTWMSHIYQETKKNKINPGLLLLTPTEHDRFDFYEGSLRKES